MVEIPVYQIKLPEYHVRSKPDHESIGAKIDKIINKRFMGQKVAIRCLSSREHRGKSVSDIVRIIKGLGIDKYNPNRKGDRYDNVQKKHIDFFALDFKIRENGRYMQYFIEPFYAWPKKLKVKPVRIDIIIIYNLYKLKRIVHKYEGRKDIKRDGFIFKYPDNKPDAVKGIIKVL